MTISSLSIIVVISLIVQNQLFATSFYTHSQTLAALPTREINYLLPRLSPMSKGSPTPSDLPAIADGD